MGRVEPSRLLPGSDGLVGEADVVVDLLELDVGLCKVGIDRQGGPKVGDRGLVLKLAARRPAELGPRQIRLRLLRVDVEGAVDGAKRPFVEAAVGRVVEKQLCVRACQRGVRQREGWVEHHRSFELLYR